MLRDGTVERVANEICWALACNLGQNTDCHFLESAIERAVFLSVMDCPHCQTLDETNARLTARIRRDVESILESNNFDRWFLDRLGHDIDQAVHLGLGGDSGEPRRAEAMFPLPRRIQK